MNLLAGAPLWLAALLALLLVLAALEDAARLRISNMLVLAVMLAAVGAALAAGFQAPLWENALVFAGLLGAGTVLFRFGKLGGGDVKLMAATGLWTDLERAPFLLAAIFLAGGVLAALILLYRHFKGRRARKGEGVGSAGIPYGVAIAAGTLATLLLTRG